MRPGMTWGLFSFQGTGVLASPILLRAECRLHCCRNPPTHQLRRLPERVRRKVGVTSRSLRLGMAKQGPN